MTRLPSFWNSSVLPPLPPLFEAQIRPQFAPDELDVGDAVGVDEPHPPLHALFKGVDELQPIEIQLLLSACGRRRVGELVVVIDLAARPLLAVVPEPMSPQENALPR